MQNKKLSQITEVKHVDLSTGEVKAEETTKVFYLPNNSEPAFFKVYIEDLTKLMNLPQGCSGLLYALAARMDYDGIISLGSVQKKNLSERLGIKRQTMDNYLGKLLKNNLMHRIARGEFMLNPDYLAKGKWDEIKRRRDAYLQLTVTYDRNGGKKVDVGTVSSTPDLFEDDTKI